MPRLGHLGFHLLTLSGGASPLDLEVLWLIVNILAGRKGGSFRYGIGIQDQAKNLCQEHCQEERCFCGLQNTSPSCLSDRVMKNVSSQRDKDKLCVESRFLALQIQLPGMKNHGHITHSCCHTRHFPNGQRLFER